MSPLEILPWGLGLFSSGLAAWGGYHRGRRRGAEIEGERWEDALAAARRSERRMAAQLQAAREEPAYPERSADLEQTRDLLALVDRLRGLTDIDDAVIVDKRGMAWTPSYDDSLLRQGAVVPLLGHHGFPWVDTLRGETDRHFFQLRRLDDDRWLVLRARRGHVGDGALAVALDRPARSRTPASPVSLHGDGPTVDGPLKTELLRLRMSTGLTLLGSGAGGSLSYASEAGTDTSALSALLGRVAAFESALAHFAAAPIQRMDIGRGDDLWFTYLPDAYLLTLSRDQFIDHPTAERLRGRLKRLVRQAPPQPPPRATAAVAV